MVGEIRDAETAEIAIQASLTGHLVLSTLHTNGAAATVTRLLEMGVEPYLLASSMAGVSHSVSFERRASIASGRSCSSRSRLCSATTRPKTIYQEPAARSVGESAIAVASASSRSYR